MATRLLVLAVMVFVRCAGNAVPVNLSTIGKIKQSFCNSSFYSDSLNRANASLAKFLQVRPSRSEGTCRCYRAGMIGGWCLPALLIIGTHFQIVGESRFIA